MQIQYKDYGFIDKNYDRELCEVILLYRLVDDLVEVVIPNLSDNNELFYHIIGVLDYYLNSNEYIGLMNYLSRGISLEMLSSVPAKYLEATSVKAKEPSSEPLGKV